MSLEHWQCGTMVYKTKHAGASETHHIFVEGGFGRGTPLVFARMTPFCYRWHLNRMACTNQQTFCSVVSMVMSHNFMGLCPVPGTDNNAPH